MGEGGRAQLRIIGGDDPLRFLAQLREAVAGQGCGVFRGAGFGTEHEANQPLEMFALEGAAEAAGLVDLFARLRGASTANPAARSTRVPGPALGRGLGGQGVPVLRVALRTGGRRADR